MLHRSERKNREGKRWGSGAGDELMEITGKGKSSYYKALDVNAGKFSAYLEEIGGLIKWREN